MKRYLIALCLLSATFAGFSQSSYIGLTESEVVSRYPGIKSERADSRTGVILAFFFPDYEIRYYFDGSKLSKNVEINVTNNEAFEAFKARFNSEAEFSGEKPWYKIIQPDGKVIMIDLNKGLSFYVQEYSPTAHNDEPTENSKSKAKKRQTKSKDTDKWFDGATEPARGLPRTK